MTRKIAMTVASAAALAFTLGACGSTSNEAQPSTPANADPTSKAAAEPTTAPVDSAWMDPEEAQDLQSTKLSCDSQYGMQTCYVILTVKNNSTGTSDYYFEYNIENKSGTQQYASDMAFVTGLRAGQTKVEKSMLLDELKNTTDAVVVITSADRSES